MAIEFLNQSMEPALWLALTNPDGQEVFIKASEVQAVSVATNAVKVLGVFVANQPPFAIHDTAANRSILGLPPAPEPSRIVPVTALGPRSVVQ